ncbi:LysR family transcriptional regulator [Neisseria sp. Ec49-e6-T10]|uniref:LysR family transcriptional regulator n=1 Tax=Neisseria sp. Ec49-e6-T10 TaxID=3140744 RepID=UPI003EB78364
MNDIQSLDLNLLKALDALLDERNVTRAALKLSLTQPAVSSMLNRLRYKFNDPLFIRVPHGMVPTDRALALAGPVKQILADINDLVQPIQVNPEQLHTTFNVAANDNDMSAIGVPFVLALKKIAPHVKVAFLSYHKVDIQLMLERGELDLILTSSDNSPLSLHSRIFYQERYVCVMRQDHPAAKSGKLTLDTFCSLEHILVSHNGGQFAGVTDEALTKIGRSRNVSLSVTSFLLLPSILQKSDFIAVAPERITRDFDHLAIIEPPIDIQGYTKIMAWHERSHRDPIQQWLRNLMWETCVK